MRACLQHPSRRCVVTVVGMKVACSEVAIIWELDFAYSAGRRRLELFGEDHNIRDGWVTVGSDLTSSNFNRQVSI